MEKTRAVILAGGKGSRLKHLVADTPKPMMKVLGLPILYHQILQLKKYGIKDITMIVGYMSEVIKDYFGSGESMGVDIEYYNEETPLGTAGGLKEVSLSLSDDFILVYGDVLFNTNLKKLMAFHKKKRACITMTLFHCDYSYDSDWVEIGSDGLVENIIHKPHEIDSNVSLSNAGIYAVNKKLLDYIPKGVESSLDMEIIPNVPNTFGYITSGYIYDIGTLDRLDKAMKEYDNYKDSI